MSAMAAWARALSNHTFPIQEAGFTFSEPQHFTPCKLIFGDQLVFNADENYVCFDSALLNLPIISSNELLKMLIEKQARQSLQALQKSTPIEQKVNRHQFARHLSAIQMATREVSMISKRYPEEFKIEAVRQVTGRGHSVAVAQVADRLGVTTHSLYAWIRELARIPSNIRTMQMTRPRSADSRKSSNALPKSETS